MVGCFRTSSRGEGGGGDPAECDRVHRGDIFLGRKPSASGSRDSFRRATWDQSKAGSGVVRGERLAQTLMEIERRFAGVTIQGSVSRWGEVALLAFDPAEGSTGVVDLSSVTDAELVQLAGRSWMPRREVSRANWRSPVAV